MITERDADAAARLVWYVATWLDVASVVRWLRESCWTLREVPGDDERWWREQYERDWERDSAADATIAPQGAHTPWRVRYRRRARVLANGRRHDGYRRIPLDGHVWPFSNAVLVGDWALCAATAASGCDASRTLRRLGRCSIWVLDGKSTRCPRRTRPAWPPGEAPCSVSMRLPRFAS